MEIPGAQAADLNVRLIVAATSPQHSRLRCVSLTKENGSAVLFLFEHKRVTNLRMARNLVFVKKPNFEGFGCSECSWVFRPASSALVGESLENMMDKFESERDKEFAAHSCEQRAKTTDLKIK